MNAVALPLDTATEARQIASRAPLAPTDLPKDFDGRDHVRMKTAIIFHCTCFAHFHPRRFAFRRRHVEGAIPGRRRVLDNVPIHPFASIALRTVTVDGAKSMFTVPAV
jgi:hypothetical protein